MAYLDLSNNQLTGPFPTWVHRLKKLIILNLGQNYFAGEIPFVIREGYFGERPLTNIREFIRLLSTSHVSSLYRKKYGMLRLNFIRMFFLKNQDI